MKKFVHSFSDHLARYVYALDFCPRKKVLDAGIQQGYGAHLLTYGADTITLSDINQKYLDEAKEWFKFFSPATFVQCDFEKDFPEGKFDVVIAFEVIEHLTPEGGEFFLKNVAEHLNEGGKLIFSVPHMVANHEHKTLYDKDKILAVINKYLDVKEYFLQDKKTISGRPMYKGLTCHVGMAEKKNETN